MSRGGPGAAASGPGSEPLARDGASPARAGNPDSAPGVACRHCGYDARGLPPGACCPECGALLPAIDGSLLLRAAPRPYVQSLILAARLMLTGLLVFLVSLLLALVLYIVSTYLPRGASDVLLVAAPVLMAACSVAFAAGVWGLHAPGPDERSAPSPFVRRAVQLLVTAFVLAEAVLLFAPVSRMVLGGAGLAVAAALRGAVAMQLLLIVADRTRVLARRVPDTRLERRAGRYGVAAVALGVLLTFWAAALALLGFPRAGPPLLLGLVFWPLLDDLHGCLVRVARQAQEART